MPSTTTAPRVPMVDNRFSSSAYQAEETDDDDDDEYNHQQSHHTGSSTSSGRRAMRKSSRNMVMDDDDFSVAPSMDQDVKSVVSVGFDDVYKRGRKVSNSMNEQMQHNVPFIPAVKMVSSGRMV
jgi:hypothetical protein